MIVNCLRYILSMIWFLLVVVGGVQGEILYFVMFEDWKFYVYVDVVGNVVGEDYVLL